MNFVRQQICAWHNRYSNDHIVYTRKHPGSGKEVAVIAGDLCASGNIPCIHQARERKRVYPELRTIFSKIPA